MLLPYSAAQIARLTVNWEIFNENFVKIDEGYGQTNKHGNDSWAYNQRGIDFIMRDQYGYDHAVQEQLFQSSPRDKFQRIILKPAANDNYPFSTGRTYTRCFCAYSF